MCGGGIVSVWWWKSECVWWNSECVVWNSECVKSECVVVE